jgi:Kef-type K+ transport system membrane component KefB
MFDTFAGLPLHPLVIHAVVVGIPLMAVITVVVAVRRNLRERYSWWVAGANLVLFLVALVAKESGESLQKARGGQLALEHGELGDVLPWFVLVLAAASAAVAGTSRNRALGPIAVVTSIVASVLAVWWCIRTGDSGARAVWG